MSRIHNKPIVRVSWVDSSSTRGWNYPEKDDAIYMKMESIGILVDKQKTHITITTSLSVQDKAMDMLSIPRKAITKIRYV